MDDGGETLAAHAVEAELGSPAIRVERLAKGHDVWRVELDDRDVVVKAGPVAMLELEAWGFRQAQAAGVPVPDVLGQAEGEMGRGWLILSKVHGTSLSKVLKNGDDHGPLLRDVGACLKRLHGTDAVGYGPPIISDGHRRRGAHSTWRAAVIARFDDRLTQLRSPSLVDPGLEGEIRHALERDGGVLDSCRYPRLLHGDFVPRHIFVDPEHGTVVGVLDFGGIDLGDPAYDLAVFSLIEMRALPELIKGYGRSSDALEELDAKIRLYRLLRSIDELAWGHYAGRNLEPQLRRLRRAASAGRSEAG